MLTLKAISEYGCGDAEHNIMLTILPSQHTEIEMPSCGPYIWNGIEYTEEGVYEQTLQSIHGCDSTVVMHLTMVDFYSFQVEQIACDSYEWAGETLIETGLYEYIFNSINGCDSIVQLHLTMFKTPRIENITGDTNVDVRLMPSSTYTADADLPSVHYTWDIAPQEAGTLDATDNTVTIVWSETYKGEAILKVAAENECGQIVKMLTINVKNSTNVNEYGINAKVYPNPTNGIVNIEAEDLQRLTVMNTLGQILYDRKVGADNAQINMTQFGTGTYLIRIYTENGTTVKRINVIQ
jgi:hypothetical protein